MAFDLGLKATLLLSMKGGSGEVSKDQFIGIKDGLIAEVSDFSDIKKNSCREWLETDSQLIIPGLINGHTHLAMSLFRGFEDDLPFNDWLFKRIFPVEAALVDEEFVKTGVQLSMLECIRFGTTTVNDMYFYPEVTAEVVDRAGLRGIIAQPFIDFVMPDERQFGEDAIPSREKRFHVFHKKYKDHPRIEVALAPHAPYTNNDEGILQVIKLARETGAQVHMHVCETEHEVSESIKVYGKTPAKRIYDLGLMDISFMAAHAVHLSDQEIELFRKTGSRIIYNPDSNLKLSSGVAPLKKFKAAGIPVAIGTDGAASNNDLSIFGAMDLGTKIQKLSAHDNMAMVALDAIRLATIDGARALGLQNKVGSIEVGKQADLVCLRTDLPHVQPMHSVLSQLVYAYQGLEVEHVVASGKILLRNQKHMTLDSTAIYQKTSQFQAKIAEYLAKIR